jgi:hypothetical protein
LENGHYLCQTTWFLQEISRMKKTLLDKKDNVSVEYSPFFNPFASNVVCRHYFYFLFFSPPYFTMPRKSEEPIMATFQLI